MQNWFYQIALSASGIGTLQTAVSLRDEDGRGDLRSVTVPTTLLYGAKDEMVPPDLIRLQQQGIPSARLEVLEQSGHGLLVEELPRFNRLFLEAVGG